MNRGEAVLGGVLTSVLITLVAWTIIYFLIFDNVLIVADQLGYNLYPVESQLWWLFVGWILLVAVRGAIKTQKYLRRDNCNHCGEELSR